MNVSELFGKAGLSYPPQLGDLNITEIVTDSRKVTKGCLFLCIKGLHTDGHGYIEDAVKNGAALIVAEQVREACVGGAAAQIVLQNTRQAAALLYHAWYDHPCRKLKIIGVTGTNGKTSVSFLLAELLRAAGYRCGLLGTVCCQGADGKALSAQNDDPLANMTTPDPAGLYRMLAQMAEEGAEYAVMEVTSHALALHKVDAIPFEIALFTNLTQDHLDFHGDMEEYFLAKARLFAMCRRAIVNCEDPYGKRLLETIAVPCMTCSDANGDYGADEIRMYGVERVSYQLKTPKGKSQVTLPMAGSFAVSNSMMAAAAALECGMDMKTVIETLKNTKGVRGRMERVHLSPMPPFSVLIDYAHTPDALEKLLRSIRAVRGEKERIVLLFGCGGERDRTKRREMAIIASRLADRIILTSDNSRGEDPETILRDIVSGMDKEKNYTVILDRREAIEEGVLFAQNGDILVLAGKGHETYEINARGRVPFDERKIVQDAWKKRCRDR